MSGSIDGIPGMTLRDYFAAKAMAALLIRGWVDADNSVVPMPYCEGAIDEDVDEGEDVTPGLQVLSEDAYRIADAMLVQKATLA